MKSQHRKLFLIVCVLVLGCTLYAQVLNNAQVLESGHWVYDALMKLNVEEGNVLLTVTEPLSITEIEYYLEQIDTDNLSEAGKALYNKTKAFISDKKAMYSDNGFSADIGAIVNPELCFKSNSNIPWSYNYNYNGNLFTAPVLLGFGDYIAIESDMYVAKNYFAAQAADNLTNIPLSFSDIRFHFPTFAYISIAKQFDGWGLNFQIGKQGKSTGQTKTGSIIYNDTFETDMYSALSIYSKILRATFDVSQISYDQFLYLHQYELKPFSNLRVELIEGSMINGTFSLRQLNPFMVMHSFMGNYENKTPLESKYYNESNVCAYLGFNFDWVPVRNSRIYGLYAMTEMQLPTELHDDGLVLPNGFGIQLGYEKNIPVSKGWWTAGIETVYTSPFLYIKQTPRTSLVKLRYYNETPDLNSTHPVATWIGSPFGPDCFAVQTSVSYDDSEKLSVSLSYLFKVHGDNYDTMLWYDDEDPDAVPNHSEGTVYQLDEEVEVYNYYPLAKYKLEKDETNPDQDRLDEIIREARDLWMSGIPEYTHQVTLDAAYSVSETVSLAGRFVYSLVFNCGNTAGSTQQGVEATLSCKIKLF